MKKLFCLLAGALLIAGVSYAQDAEILSESFKAATPNCTVDDIGKVVVEKKSVIIVKEKFTLEQLDFFISIYKAQIEMFQKQLDLLTELRAAVEAEAKKVTLGDGKSS